MNPKDRAEILEECLRELQSGKPLEQVLDEHGPAAESVRHVLEAASAARAAGRTRAIPAGAQARSRAQFLAAAEQARSPRPLPFIHLRFSTSVLAIVLVLMIVTVVGSGFASAQSLPGDALYPFKITIERARLNFAQDTASRLTLEEDFDKERAEETGQLIHLGRSEEMNFAGFLRGGADDGWMVSGLPLSLSPEQQKLALRYQGTYVEIEGIASRNGVLVDSIKARLFNLSGTVQQVQNNQWIVGGVTVHNDQRTKISARPAVGQNVYVTAMRQENGDLVALVISALPETATYVPPTHESENEHEAVGTSIPTPGNSSNWQEPAVTATPEGQDSIEEKIVTPESSGGSEQENPSHHDSGESESSHPSDSQDGEHSDGHSSGDH